MTFTESSLAEEIRSCRSCTACHFSSPVPGEGPEEASIVFMGRSPGCFSVRTNLAFEQGNMPAYKAFGRLDLEVEAVDLDTGKPSVQRVVKWFKNGSAPQKEWNRLEWGKNVGYFTSDHSLLKRGNWVQVSGLKVHDKIDGIKYVLGPNSEQVLLGTLLGDSMIYLDKRSKTKKAYFELYQGDAQKEYLKWKQDILCPLTLDSGSRERIRFEHCDSVWTVTSKQLDELYPYWDFLKKNTKIKRQKKISVDYLDKMGPLALAVWFQDDGCLNNLYETKRKGQRGNYTIGISNFLKTGARATQEFFRERLNLEASLTEGLEKNGNDRLILTLSVEASEKFSEMIAPYVHPTMRYKLIPKYRDVLYREISCDVSRELVSDCVEVRKITGVQDKGRVRYSMEVENLHNYVLPGGVVSKNSTENDRGRPFVGPGGKLFSKHLDLLGLKRPNIGVINALNCFKRKDEPPTRKEFEVCGEKFMQRKIDFFKNKKLIFTCGNDSTRLLLKDWDFPSVTRIRQPIRQDGFWVWPILHVGYMLRRPTVRKSFEEETLPRIKEFLEALNEEA